LTRRTAAAAVVALAAALPWALSDYRVFQLTLVLTVAIALLGLNLLTGINGQISLGHGAFSAAGAYCAAILMDRFGLPYWLTIPIAAAICFGAGFLFGLPALRFEGLYLALATFALAVATPQLLKHRLFERWTGGVQGIVLAKPEAPFGLPISQDRWLYWFSLGVAAIMFLLAWNLIRGRIGRALVAIRDQPLAAESLGIDTSFYKSTTFGISAMYAGVSGALGAIVLQFVSPDGFSVFLSLGFLVGIVVGGLGSIPGAIIGALFIHYVPPAASRLSQAAPWAVYGVAVIVFVYLFPTGIAGLLRPIRGGRNVDRA